MKVIFLVRDNNRTSCVFPQDRIFSILKLILHFLFSNDDNDSDDDNNNKNNNNDNSKNNKKTRY